MSKLKRTERGQAFHLSQARVLPAGGQGIGCGYHNIEMVLEETLIGQGLMNPTTAEGYDPNGEGGCEFTLQVITLWQ